MYKRQIQQVIILGDILIVEIGNTKIQQDIKKKSKIEQGRVPSIFPWSYQILNSPVDAEYPCLLYTSDAADERSSVDLGGRRIIKKKKKTTNRKKKKKKTRRRKEAETEYKTRASTST